MKANKARLVPIADLTPNPDNPRTIFDERFDDLVHSLREDPEFLWARPLVATSAGVVYAGNQRLKAATELGMKEVPVVTLDGTPEEIRIRLLRDNQEYGEWDLPVVGKMLASMADGDEDTRMTGFDDGAVSALIRAWAGDDEEPPGEFDEVPDELPTDHRCPSCGYRWSGDSHGKGDE